MDYHSSSHHGGTLSLESNPHGPDGDGADNIEGKDWYRRAMRAHANCIENLPVYGAVVVAIVVTGAASQTLDLLAIVLLVARVCQTVVHVAFKETNPMVALDSVFS